MEIAYRITDDPVSISVLGPGMVLAAAVCAGMIGVWRLVRWSRHRIARPGHAKGVLVGVVILLAASASMGTVSSLMLAAQLRLRRHLVGEYLSGHARVTEGVVQVLRKQPRGGHAPGDLIDIGGRQLEVNYYGMSVGYRRTVEHGGVLQQDQHARILDVDGTIVEIALPANEMAPAHR